VCFAARPPTTAPLTRSADSGWTFRAGRPICSDRSPWQRRRPPANGWPPRQPARTHRPSPDGRGRPRARPRVSGPGPEWGRRPWAAPAGSALRRGRAAARKVLAAAEADQEAERHAARQRIIDAGGRANQPSWHAPTTNLRTARYSPPARPPVHECTAGGERRRAHGSFGAGRSPKGSCKCPTVCRPPALSASWGATPCRADPAKRRVHCGPPTGGRLGRYA
jgi:hypothetical protein